MMQKGILHIKDYKKKTKLILKKLFEFGITPNLVTFFRLLLVLISCIFILKTEFLIFELLFLMGLFLDVFDGFFARSIDQVSKNGTLIDLYSDSLVVFFVFLSFTILNFSWLNLLSLFIFLICQLLILLKGFPEKYIGSIIILTPILILTPLMFQEFLMVILFTNLYGLLAIIFCIFTKKTYRQRSKGL